VSFSQWWTVFFLAVLSPVVWSLIYYFRAVTEEQHLLRGENGYREYMQKVKYRMIPGII
jgi:protein-S-isoprenylcysteine O-methyltransferase Ste14